MNIEEALEITGFSLCEFKADEGDECATCGEVMGKGTDVYYERTSWECEEGDYHCEKCVIAKPQEWKDQAEYYDNLHVSKE